MEVSLKMIGVFFVGMFFTVGEECAGDFFMTDGMVRCVDLDTAHDRFNVVITRSASPFFTLRRLIYFGVTFLKIIREIQSD